LQGTILSIKGEKRLIDGIPHDLTLLLGRLAIGAATPVYSPNEWAARLHGVPSATAFLDQLRAEWLPIPLLSPFSQQIAEQCRGRMAAWHSGWPNLWAHTLRVAGYAVHLAPDAGISADQAFVLAVLHDVGKFDELRDGIAHEQIAADLAREWLFTEYPAEVVMSIADAVGKEGRSSDPFVRLLHDSDKLEKIGASGIVRRVSQVVTLPNALDAVHRVEADLRRFPSMKLDAAKPIAAQKREFTDAFIAELEETDARTLQAE
jgi:HD superfamily phosphodiesterase